MMVGAGLPLTIACWHAPGSLFAFVSMILLTRGKTLSYSVRWSTGDELEGTGRAALL